MPTPFSIDFVRTIISSPTSGVVSVPLFSGSPLTLSMDVEKVLGAGFHSPITGGNFSLAAGKVAISTSTGVYIFEDFSGPPSSLIINGTDTVSGVSGTLFSGAISQNSPEALAAWLAQDQPGSPEARLTVTPAAPVVTPGVATLRSGIAAGGTINPALLSFYGLTGGVVTDGIVFVGMFLTLSDGVLSGTNRSFILTINGVTP